MPTPASQLARARLSAVLIALPLWLAGCPSSNSKAPVAAAQPSSARDGLFRDVAHQAGIRFAHDPGLTGEFRFVETTPGGCAFLDYDQDGRLDLFLIQSGPAPGSPPGRPRPACALYRNVGAKGYPRFKDVTADAGLAMDFGYAQGVAAADYDNNGTTDLYITAYGGNHLLQNDGHGRFVDVTAQSGVGDRDQGPRWATSAAWADYDGDGLLDLYVCHYCKWSVSADLKCVNRLGERTYCHPTQYPADTGRLYKNVGAGRFRDATHESGVDAVAGRGLGCVWLDYDGDGRPDLYVANDLSPNLLFRNTGGGTFKEVGLEAGAAVASDGQALSGMGIAVGDYDRDGHEDLYVTNFSGQTNSLFRNAGSGQFLHSTHAAGLAEPTHAFLAWGVAFLDYDLDGFPDIVTGNGHVNPDIDRTGIGVTYREPKGLFRNRRDGTFEETSARGGSLLEPVVCRGLAVGDVDNDGRPDILANNLGGPAQLLLNVAPAQGHFLTLRLVGTRSNRDAVGARIRILAGGREQIGYCRRNSSYASSSDPRLSFGLGAVTSVDRIEVLWPSGRKDLITEVEGRHPIPLDSFLALTEGKPAMIERTP
jgi:enediyne biosynthesis protein E4